MQNIQIIPSECCVTPGHTISVYHLSSKTWNMHGRILIPKLVFANYVKEMFRLFGFHLLGTVNYNEAEFVTNGIQMKCRIVTSIIHFFLHCVQLYFSVSLSMIATWAQVLVLCLWNF